jgi:hypothetical protein
VNDLTGSFLVIVLLPALAVFAILRLAGARVVTALMWASITMAVVAVLVWLTFSGDVAR